MDIKNDWEQHSDFLNECYQKAGIAGLGHHGSKWNWPENENERYYSLLFMRCGQNVSIDFHVDAESNLKNIEYTSRYRGKLYIHDVTQDVFANQLWDDILHVQCNELYCNNFLGLTWNNVI